MTMIGYISFIFKWKHIAIFSPKCVLWWLLISVAFINSAYPNCYLFELSNFHQGLYSMFCAILSALSVLNKDTYHYQHFKNQESVIWRILPKGSQQQWKVREKVSFLKTLKNMNPNDNFIFNNIIRKLIFNIFLGKTENME